MDIHDQLLQDCHLLGRLEAGMLLLHRNAELPWFILVPDTSLADVLDLPEPERQAVVDACAAVSGFIKQQLGYDKVNFAGLGNVVPQMHLHIIGRSSNDACWPQPVWGNLATESAYEEDTLAQWREQLTSALGLEATG